MGFNYKIYLAEFLIIFFFVGCAHPVSQEIRKGIDPDIKFETLVENPKLYLGKRVLFGGVIVVARNLEDGTELEIVQKNLESYGNLEAGDYSGGRFPFF
jgi:starvation-inducible outer membrane lipoprotein